MSDEVSSIPAVALLVASGAWFFRIYQSRRQFSANFFSEYTKRYQGIFVNLPLNILSEDFDYSLVSENEADLYKRWIKCYFDLCSEEYHLNSKGMIDLDVWILWERGMKSSFHKPALQLVWNEISSFGYFDVRFMKFVERIQSVKE